MKKRMPHAAVPCSGINAHGNPLLVPRTNRLPVWFIFPTSVLYTCTYKVLCVIALEFTAIQTWCIQ